MSSPHVSFLDRTDSIESCLDDSFEDDDDSSDEDYIDKCSVDLEKATLPTFIVEDYSEAGKCQQHHERETSTTAPSTVKDRPAAPVKYFTHKLSFRGWLRWFFIRNTSTRLAIAIFDFTLKIFICASYIIRVDLDNITQYECNGHPCLELENGTGNQRELIFKEHDINWYVLIWVQRSNPVWIVELFLAFIELSKSLMMVYIATKGHRMEQVLSLTFILEILCGVNMLITLVPVLKNLFVPVFLNCWLGRLALERIYNDLHLTSQRFQTVSVRLTKKMVLLVMNIACLTFTTMCSIQHIQRASFDNQITLFDSFYFVIVTFSSVGFGDISPDMWLSRLFMVIMICLAFATIPSQIEGMISTYRESQKAGGEYNSWSTSQKHVIVCTSSMTQDTMMDFLNEFYMQPKVQERTVILLCCQELDSSKRVIITDPRWSQKVIYMKGSALKDMDLQRCHAQQAYACFFLAPRPTQDKSMADRHTILRSWAVKDFAPNCKQYVYLFKAVNRLHVKYAEHIMCEDEFSFALLANNCLYPGLSTLVSLLVHSTKEQQKGMVLEPWQQLYGRHSANEIFHIQVQKSIIFSQYEGETFPKSSADAHNRYGVALLAVLDSQCSNPRLQLNPGPQYKLKALDMLFYMSLNREEYSKMSPEVLEAEARRKSSVLQPQLGQTMQGNQTVVLDGTKDNAKGGSGVYGRITNFLGYNFSLVGSTNNNRNRRYGDNGATTVSTEDNSNSEQHLLTSSSTSTQKSMTSCSSAPLLAGIYDSGFDDLSQRRRRHGVVDLNSSTDDEMNTSHEGHHIDLRHGEGRVLQFYEDMEQLTIGAPPVTSGTGVGSASCHIRTAIRDPCCLQWGKSCKHCSYRNANDQRWDNQLIILVAEHASSGMFNFIVPLRSSAIGVNGLSPIILLLEEEPDCLFVEAMAHFPLLYYMVGSIKSIDDLLVAGINKASHLVIVNRDPENSFEGEEFLEDSETVVAVQTISRLFPNTYVLTALSQSSNMRFMRFSASHSQKQLIVSAVSAVKEIFRLPFAAGQVFSANLLDTLLYQTFNKGYLISFVRLLLGIDSETGSGHLSSIRVKKSTVQRFRFYKDLYSWLSSATGEIPFAIYRTELVAKDESKDAVAHTLEGDEFLEHPDRKIFRIRKSSKEVPTSSVVSGYHFSAACKTSPVDLGSLIRSRLQSLDMTQSNYSDVKCRHSILSYIITNPSPTELLKVGDIIYVIQPSSMWATPSRQQYFLRRSHSAPKMNSTGTPQTLKKFSVLKVPSKEGLKVPSREGRVRRSSYN